MFDYFRLQRLRYVTLRAYRLGDWREILIKENGQPLIEVPSEISFPYYARVMKLVVDERMYLREEVLDRVLKARKRLLPRGLDLKVYDGWRSVELQESLYWYYMRAFTARKFYQIESYEQHHQLDNDIRSYFSSLPADMQTAMHEINRVYVSWPSKDSASPSPHATGGAVDVWLFRNGTEADLGVPFDWMKEEAGAFYHLKLRRKSFACNKRFSYHDQLVCRNRSQLILAMARAGFSCYGPEFWHFNYGNQMDALVKGGNACYSYIEP